MSDKKTLQIPDEIKDEMWQFFYKTSIPRLIAKQKEKEHAELEERESEMVEKEKD